MKERTALILEGGSLRCVFTAGVLDTFTANGIEFPCVGGVSSGSLSGLNYVSKQMGRTAKISIDFIRDKRYSGISSLIHNHSIFNFDFLFGDIAKELLPFDEEEFYNSPQRYVAFATDCKTGKLVGFEKGKTKDLMMACRSSSSMPLLSPIVHVDGMECLDGGIANPIPVDWAINEGYEKIVVVLTRHKEYRKSSAPKAVIRAYERAYKQYPRLIKKLKQIPNHYNEIKETITQLEEEGRIFVIRPEEPVLVSRVEKDAQKLRDLYKTGKTVANKRMEDMLAYLEE